MAYEHLIVQTADGIMTITINRPQALNVLTAATVRELEQALLAAGQEPAVKVLILTGAGEKAFVAGGDLREVLAGITAGATVARDQFARRGQGLITLIERLGKPVIAAVNGLALGGGAELAMLADFIIASDTARFGQPEINLGILPGDGATQRLPRLAGRGMAMRMILTGQQIDAQNALRAGLVTEVVPAEQILERSLDVAEVIAAKAPLAARYAKQAVGMADESTLSAGLMFERKMLASAFETEDQKEGMAAFVQKRPARFVGR